MGLSRITLTGIDERTDLSKVWMLSKMHPLVEWGVLYDQEAGRGGQYATRPFILDLLEFAGRSGVNLSLHICGRTVHKLLDGDATLMEMSYQFPRIQLNIRHKQDPINRINLLRFIEDRKKPVITQHNDNNVEVTPHLASVYHEVLFDSSEGTGKEIDQFSYMAYKRRCGWAGGLNIENLPRLLPKMYLAAQDRAWWFDLESGLRTDGCFDINKAEQVLKISREVCIGRSNCP